MKKILYLTSFTTQATGSHHGSDAVGYGITSSNAILQALRQNFDVVVVPSESTLYKTNLDYLNWTLISYQETLALLQNDPPDLIFIFHCFQQFPQEIKKMLCSLKLNIPIVGYTHGSHWDHTDTFREIFFPGFAITDLANFCSMDEILVVTQAFKETIVREIGVFNVEIAQRIARKSHVVGLPINTALIDSFALDSSYKKDEWIRIVFNHTMIPSKNIKLFLQILNFLMPLYPIQCHITRAMMPNTFEYDEIQRLSRLYPGRVIVGNTLAFPEYYRLLWEADIQVSTATHESLGIATLEAMYTQNCCLLPVLDSYCEISRPETAHLYHDEAELLTKIKYFIENELARKQLAKRLAVAATRYSIASIYPNLHRVCEQVLANSLLKA